MIKRKKHLYKSNDITISYEPEICIHAAECVRGLPEVFNTSNKPWVIPENADPEQIAEIIKKCPSGALKYENLQDAGLKETFDTPSIKVRKNGPLYIQGNILLISPEGEILEEVDRLALCRCGHSTNKPYCDNTHRKVKFNG